MGKARPSGQKQSDDDNSAIVILLTLADTTWRIMAPVGLLAGLGIWADLRFGTKPWLTFLGVIAGFALAVMLIRALLQKVATLEKTHPK